MTEKFPNKIPIFPLSGVIYFPKTNLPLNIFEQRYLDLVNDAIKKDKLMGMIQSKKSDGEVYKVGCLGKISDFKKSDDGRMLINLTGLVRFEILGEKTNKKSYREFEVNYKKFTMDLEVKKEKINTDTLMDKTKAFFNRNGLLLNWKEFDKLDEIQKINTLSMIAPVSNEEKQKMLESISLKERIETFEEIISFYLHDNGSNSQTVQ